QRPGGGTGILSELRTMSSVSAGNAALFMAATLRRTDPLVMGVVPRIRVRNPGDRGRAGRCGAAHCEVWLGASMMAARSWGWDSLSPAAVMRTNLPLSFSSGTEFAPT